MDERTKRLDFVDAAEQRAWLRDRAASDLAAALATVELAWSQLPASVAQNVPRMVLEEMRIAGENFESIVGTVNEAAFAERARNLFRLSVMLWFEVMSRLLDPVDESLELSSGPICSAINRLPSFEALRAEASEMEQEMGRLPISPA